MADEAAQPVLSIQRLTKSYAIGILQRRRRIALDDLSLDVSAGEVFGYLGPNGSGKTTTLKVVMGMVFADRGEVRVLGRPLSDRSWRFEVGYLPEHPYLYDGLTPAEYLDYAGRLLGMAREARRRQAGLLLERVGLAHAANTPMRRFSKGMVQRAGIAQALMGDPSLLFFDEPMSGLDPIGRRLVRNIILDLQRAGKTVFFSTHILGDAESLCDRVAVLRSGRLVNVGRLDAILKIDVEHLELLVSGVSELVLDGLPGGPHPRHAAGERWRVEVAEPWLGRAITAIETAGGRVLAVQPVRQSLEEYFFKELAPEKGTDPWLLQD